MPLFPFVGGSPWPLSFLSWCIAQPQTDSAVCSQPPFITGCQILWGMDSSLPRRWLSLLLSSVDMGKAPLRVRALHSLSFLISDFPLGLSSGLSNCFHATNRFCSLLHRGEFYILGWMMPSIGTYCQCSWVAESKLLTLRIFRNNKIIKITSH